MFWSRSPPVTSPEYQWKIAHRVRDILTGADHANHHKHMAGKKNKMAIKALQRPEALAGVIDILRTMPEPTIETIEDDDDDNSPGQSGEDSSASANSTNELVSIASASAPKAVKDNKGKEKKKMLDKSGDKDDKVDSTSTTTSTSALVVSKNANGTKEQPAADKDKKGSKDQTMKVAAAVTGTLAVASVVTTYVVKRPLYYPPKDIVSSQAFWWGYEVYIPEKALSRIAAAQDVSTAFLSFLSTVGLMVPAIVPFLGYIAAYVGLEFAVIKAQNEGRGVILASTWLLPVALVPRAWDIPDPEPEIEMEAEAK
ncbi:hypothetical protein BGW41_001271 [Actinomortierella wolfii]|nr:hypothetical protein BGW41_001271 [Actinomortierella wolfii]